MKIILSRKGFDGSNGGCASPVFPDGTMLSMPIPSKGETISYKDLIYDELSYFDLLMMYQTECLKIGVSRYEIDRIFSEILPCGNVK